MHQKKEKNFLYKMSPHLSQLNVAMAHRNHFRKNNMRILKLATYTKIEDHYSTDTNTDKLLHILILSVESQKGAINIQRCSVENQKGAIGVQSLWQ